MPTPKKKMTAPNENPALWQLIEKSKEQLEIMKNYIEDAEEALDNLERAEEDFQCGMDTLSDLLARIKKIRTGT